MATTLSSATEDRLFNIICSKAGIQPGELSTESRHALLNDQQNTTLWNQLRGKFQGSGNDRSTHARVGGQQFAEFERVVGVESICGQLSLTPERIQQTEDELEALNRKTQSLVDTLKSHNARLEAMTGAGGGGASTNAAQAALEAKVRELKERRKELDEECEQLAVHADQRLDRYIASGERDIQQSQPQSQDASSSGTVKALRNTFDGLLQPHDRILEKLDALCTELQFDDTEQKGLFDDARRLSNEIIFAIVAHQRMVLDIVFIQACKSYQKSGRKGSASAIENEREAIIDDLRSLWDEVVPVAHMAVEKQLVGPIMKAKAGTSDVRDQRYALIATYTCSMLRYMNERLEEFAARIKTLVAHHKALVKTFEVFQARSQEHNEERDASAMPSPQDNSAAARISRGNKRTGRVQASTTPLDSLLSAIEVLGLSIPPPPQSNDSSSYNTADLAAHLDKHIQRRSVKSYNLAIDMQSLFEATAKSTMGDSLDATRLLAESLVAECNGGISSFTPPASDARTNNTSAHRSSISKMFLEVGGGFFADAELEKIIADEARSVAGIAEGFNKLLKHVDGDAGLTPGQFVKDAHKRASTAQETMGSSTMSAKASTQLKDPKVHEIVEKWGR